MSESSRQEGGLDPFQADVAKVALAATEAWGFALADGNALIAHGLLTRPTQDVDLFTTAPGGPGATADIVAEVLRGEGLSVTCDVAANGEFARLQVSNTENAVVVDLARDWRAHPPVRMTIGLVLHRDDAVASKVGAMVGRGLPRDFVDVAAALAQYKRRELLRLLFERDPGLRPADVALAVRQLDLLTADDFAPYGLEPSAVVQLRSRFEPWPREAAQDGEAREAHEDAHSSGQG